MWGTGCAAKKIMATRSSEDSEHFHTSTMKGSSVIVRLHAHGSFFVSCSKHSDILMAVNVQWGRSTVMKFSLFNKLIMILQGATSPQVVFFIFIFRADLELHMGRRPASKLSDWMFYPALSPTPPHNHQPQPPHSHIDLLFIYLPDNDLIITK